MMVKLGGFSAKWNLVIATYDSINFEGLKNDFLTSSFSFHQIINKPTYILNNSASRTDLIFYKFSKRIKFLSFSYAICHKSI